MERIYKYPLVPEDWTTVRMPEGAEPLCVQVQGGAPFLWARVDIDRAPVLHHFRIAGTGHDLGSNIGRYIGTIQLEGGSLVFHVFSEKGLPRE